jgi:hypothetical protein
MVRMPAIIRINKAVCALRFLVDATLPSDREARFLSPAYQFRVTAPRGKVHTPSVLLV